MADDISNKTIVVLVVLTVIISVLGALVVTNGIGTLNTASQEERVVTSSSQGKVSLTILPEPESTTANGMVTLTILPNA